MNYLKGTFKSCEAYNEAVYNAFYQNQIGTINWMKPIERDGDFYIRKHPDYPATSGLTEADLPPAPEATDVI